MRPSSGLRTSTSKTLNNLRSRSRWFGLVPDIVAEKQVAWERRDAVTRMKHLGFTLDEIAMQWCTSSAMISYLLRHHATKSRSPVVKWLADETDILTLAKLIRHTALKQLIHDLGSEAHSGPTPAGHQ